MQDILNRSGQKMVSLLDLTSLTGVETEADIEALCSRASGPCGQVAAICVFSRHLPWAIAALKRRSLERIGLATVANFPGGDLDPAGTVREIDEALALGATEVDLVFPYRAFLDGREREVKDFLDACRRACPVRLKVILETGVLGSREAIHAVASLAVDHGADFLKTSTGKAAVHATPEAARVMLQVIAQKGTPTGFKASGGLRTMADAQVYLDLAEEIMGKDWIGPHTFRFGASSLLDDILARTNSSESA
ncbi:deoxyribose-phosphate aldolase [Desulfomicrobium apsheronum]|uniref:Deoxyribose-phosphate aldolase n=1 Tax=Desulfomicrobium apsheronum TaxID=52560 RepID=A0A1I3QKE0_9BACT|nr:deoxyribose-phosphate aldolase [Desulfomicrobium apsheronum]SFJ33751.1 deoxyribose-phosphate aldolase [Desulfomicrobium apsheronum]